MSVSLALRGEGLGAMWGRHQAQELLSEAGFTQVSIKNVKQDMLNNYYICTKG
jgi:hypothetical protein